MPTAASVRPASASAGSRDRSTGSTPSKTGTRIASPPPSGSAHHLAADAVGGKAPGADTGGKRPERAGIRLDDVSGAPQNDRQKRSLIGSQHCPGGGRSDRGGAGPGGHPADVRRAGRRPQPGRGRGGGGGRDALRPGARRDGG